MKGLKLTPRFGVIGAAAAAVATVAQCKESEREYSDAASRLEPPEDGVKEDKEDITEF